MVLYFKSSAHSAGPLRPCGLLSLARGPALARALPLALGLALALALAVALALRLALPLVFALAPASFFARRKRQHGAPEEPKSTPGGRKWPPGGLWGPPGPKAGQNGRQGRSGSPLDGSWSALGGSWSRLGALLAPLGAVWGSPTPLDRREALLDGIFGGLPREAEKSTMFDAFSHLLEPLFKAFLGRLLWSLGLRRRGRAP